MNTDKEFFRHPAWEELLRNIKHEISQAQRAPDQIILDDVDLCNLLKLSKRTTATLRANNEITFYKCGGKILYKLSDALAYVERHKIGAKSNSIKSRIK